jgi:hypothetical protein
VTPIIPSFLFWPFRSPFVSNPTSLQHPSTRNPYIRGARLDVLLDHIHPFLVYSRVLPSSYNIISKSGMGIFLRWTIFCLLCSCSKLSGGIIRGKNNVKERSTKEIISEFWLFQFYFDQTTVTVTNYREKRWSCLWS